MSLVSSAAQSPVRRLVAERATLKYVLDEVGHPYHEAVWMLQLMIEQTEDEKRWIERLLKDANKRAPARNRATANR